MSARPRTQPAPGLQPHPAREGFSDRPLEELSPSENEDVCHFLFEASSYGFVVRTVEAPFFRRVVDWRMENGTGADPVRRYSLGPLYESVSARLRKRLGEPTSEPKAHVGGTRDGKGVVFVASDGEVYPAGFLPLSLGNVRRESIVDIYRDHPLLKEIRAAHFHGRCGACEYANLCGGSRARAFASSGDPLGEDPACPYVPGEGSDVGTANRAARRNSSKRRSRTSF